MDEGSRNRVTVSTVWYRLGTCLVVYSGSFETFFYNLSNLRRDDEELAPFRKNLEMSVSQSEFRTACQPCHLILVVP